MFYKQKKGSGFTIIDLMVSIAIMGLLTLTVVISFIQSERNQNLSNAAEVFASQLREVENWALAGKAVKATNVFTGEEKEVVPAGGYGIKFSKSSLDGKISYLFFADMIRDLIYDTAIPPTDYFPYSDQEVELKTQYSFQDKDIKIENVVWAEIQGVLAADRPLNIVFKIPEAKVYVNGKSNIDHIYIRLKHQKTLKTKGITIYPASRQISVE